VLEVRPPVRMDKGLGVRRLLRESDVSSAMYAGDDATDLDAFDALDSVEVAVRVGVRSDEGPPAIVERADLVVEGTDGVLAVLAALAGEL
jgi:trehalose 6-phosphate phosphatase